MNNSQCEYCGHINQAGAEICESCDFPLGAPRRGEEADPSGEPSWTASDAAAPGGGWSPTDDIPSPADSIPAPPFKGAGDVISPMLAVYRKHFTLVGILVLVVTVPVALLQYGVIDVTGEGPVTVIGSSGMGGFVTPGGVLLWLLSVAGGALLSGSLVYAVVDLQRAGRSSAGECLARGLKALPNVFLVTLLYGIIVFVGYVLLVVPGVIASLMFAVCVPSAIVEGRGPIGALKRSYALTKGYKGLIFITYFLWGLLILVLSWVVSWSFMSGGTLDLLPSLLLQTAVLGMFNSTVHVLTVYIYLGLLRERRSGFSTNTFTPGPEVTAG